MGCCKMLLMPHRIYLSLTRTPTGQVSLRIRDQGQGIPFTPLAISAAELAPGPSTKRFGTGLGIPFAFKVCQVHEAQLRFERPADGGTAVWLELPLAS